jgi:hypothetical protein
VTTKNCDSCAHCYLDLDYGPVCGHRDSGEFGCNPAMARGTGLVYENDSRYGHCGQTLTKWEQHPLRLPVVADGSTGR